MNVIEQFTLRSLKRNRKWTVVTIIGIIISTSMITAVSTFCSSFITLMRNRAIVSDGNWHATITNVKVSDIKTIENAKFIKQVMLSRNIGYARLNGSKNDQKPYLFIEQYDMKNNIKFPTTLVAGRMPQNDGELVLSQHIQTNGGVTYHIGDKLKLNIGKRIGSDGKELLQDTSLQSGNTKDEKGEVTYEEKLVPESTKIYTVVGIIKRPNFEPRWAPGYTAVTYLDESALKPDDNVNVTILAGKLTHHFFDDVNSLAGSVGKDANEVEFNDELLRYYGAVKDDNTQTIIYGFVLIMIVIIMIASISLIYNAFAISVSERTRQLGMLASVGATKGQKRQNVYFEALLIGLVGIPAGIAAGIAGIGITIFALRPLMESFTSFSSYGLQLELVVSPLSIAVAVVFAALTIFISAWIPARRASRIMPIDAIRQTKEIKLTKKTVKVSRLVRPLFGFEGEIALKNLKRNRRKYRATVLSLIISLVLFLTVSYYADFAGKASSARYMGLNYDISVDYMDVPPSEIKELNGKIARLDFVTDSAMAQVTEGIFLADKTQLTETAKKIVKSMKPDKQGKYNISARIYCLDGPAFEKYAKSVGADPRDYENPDVLNGILINYIKVPIDKKYVAGENLNIKPGGLLHFCYPYRENQLEKFDFIAGTVTDKRPMGILTQSYENTLVVSEEVFKAFQSKLRPEYQKSIRQSMYLNTSNSDKLEEQIKKLTDNTLNGRIIILNIAASAKSERDYRLFLEVFIYGFIILISLICIANIFNTISTSVALRRKEFAMLRSVGMTPRSFNKMIRFESVFYGMKALLYGLPISIAIAWRLYYLEGLKYDFEFSLPWANYGVAIALVFIIVASTMLYSSAKIKKENIIDALKEEDM
ncbi:MAG: FtsX-like permease family protein [Clostridiales bacterium]|nr:FtsX-like permease family protein [Clostridiales bacterium]